MAESRAVRRPIYAFRDRWSNACSACGELTGTRNRGVVVAPTKARTMPLAVHFALCKACVRKICRVALRPRTQ